MENPICYFVQCMHSGWTVHFDNFGDIHHFPTREKALEAAREAARNRWQMAGLKSCVKIREADGNMVDDVAFGSGG